MSSSYLRCFVKSFAPIFQPPFAGLGLVVVLYFAWCYFVYPHSQILRGNLPDPDDYTYLTQVLDWMKGQGWYDNVQHRLNPPPDGSLGGTPIHFSRLVMIPMAGVIWLIERLGLGPRGAATVMAVFEPLILFGCFLVSLRWAAESFMPKRWTGATAYTTLFAASALHMFIPGHVDHHGLNLILTTLTLGCASRMIQKPDEMRWGILAGLLMALAMTVALEVLPWLLIISATLVLWGAIKGKGAAQHTLLYGLTLYLSSLAFLLLTRPPATFFEPDILTYSITYAFLTGGVAVVTAGVAALADSKLWLRLFAGLALAAATGTMFLFRFPELLGGPYGAMDPELARIMLGEIDETKPVIHMGYPFIHLGAALMALVAGISFLWRARGKERWLWSLWMAMLSAAFLLTLFYQYRFAAAMAAFTIIPLTVLLQRGWRWAGDNLAGRRKVYAEIGLLLLIGPLPAVFYPALIDGRSFNTGVLMFPVEGNYGRNLCDTFQLEQILNDPKFYGDHPRLILSGMGMGSELLFRTKHQVLSAPYHMDVSGNIDATRFLSTSKPEEAEAIARRRHIDLIAVCRFVPDLYLHADPVPASLKGTSSPKPMPHMIEILMQYKAPNWLKPISFVTMPNFVIYEVQLPKTGEKTPVP